MCRAPCLITLKFPGETRSLVRRSHTGRITELLKLRAQCGQFLERYPQVKVQNLYTRSLLRFQAYLAAQSVSSFCAIVMPPTSLMPHSAARCSDNLWRPVLLMSSSSQWRRKLPAATWNDRAPRLVWGTEFLPEKSPWLRILSVKQSGDHLCLRYGLAAKQGSQVER